MSKMGWLSAVSCAAMVAMSASAWAATNRPGTLTGAQAGRSVAPEKVFVRKPFTADMVVTSARQNGQTLHGRMYAGNQAMRMDLEMEPGMDTSTIVRFDKKVVWMLMPGEQRYMEMPITPRAGMMATLHNSGVKYELRDLGAVKVGSYSCEKYRVHWTDQGQNGSGFVWVASTGTVKGFIVRAEDEKTGATNEYHNIQPGEPSASLFDLPAGYEKMDLPAPHR
ncbi:MAG: DUF4412 domain-containing protein [Acidobacteriota bacterium]|nr:DUF4412 domain-containing protein [Acidobacteriota bacterium]